MYKQFCILHEQVYEDEAEGFLVAGLTMRMAKNSEEMRASFNK